MSWHGYAGDGGGPLSPDQALQAQGMGSGRGLDPLFSGQAQARLNEQCRKAQVTQAAVDARAAEIEARERAAARAAARAPWSKYPGVLAGDIEGRKKAEEACSRSTVPEPPAPEAGNIVTGNCDQQGAAIVEQDRALSAAFAGLLYDFAGYLTTRDGAFAVGSRAHPGPVLDALVEFAKARCLSLAEANVERWHEALAALALPQVQAGPAATNEALAVETQPGSPSFEGGAAYDCWLTSIAPLPDGRGKR